MAALARQVTAPCAKFGEDSIALASGTTVAEARLQLGVPATYPARTGNRFAPEDTVIADGAVVTFHEPAPELG